MRVLLQRVSRASVTVECERVAEISGGFLALVGVGHDAMLDALGVISVTERQSYIMRVRELAKACGEAWVHTEAGRAV